MAAAAAAVILNVEPPAAAGEDVEPLAAQAVYTGFTDPRCVAISPDGRYALVTNFGSSYISRIDLETDQVAHVFSGFSRPWGIAISPDGKFALVGNSNGNNVGFVDLVSNAVSFPYKGFHCPIGVAISRDISFALVVNHCGNCVGRINLVSGRVSFPYSGFKNPDGIDITPDGSFALVANNGNHSIARIDLQSGKVTFLFGDKTDTGKNSKGKSKRKNRKKCKQDEEPCFEYPHDVAISSDGSFAVVANNKGDNVGHIDLASGQVTFPYGKGGVFSTPLGVAIAPDNSFMLVVNNGTNTISRHKLPDPSITPEMLVASISEPMQRRDVAMLRHALDAASEGGGGPKKLAKHPAVAAAINAGNVFLSKLDSEAPLELQLRHALEGGRSPEIAAALADVTASLQGQAPVRGGALESTIAEASQKVSGRVQRMLQRRFGREPTLPHVVHLTDDELDALLPLAAKYAPADLSSANGSEFGEACVCGAPAPANHEALQHVIQELADLSSTMKSLTSSHEAGLSDTSRMVDHLTDQTQRFRGAVEKLCTKAVKALRLDVATTSEMLKHQERLLATAGQSLEGTQQQLRALQEHGRHLQALSDMVASLLGTRKAELRQWEDFLGRTGVLESLAVRDLENMLVFLGRCEWVQAFANHSVTADMLPTLSDGMLKLVVQETSTGCFGDVRSFRLLVEQLQAGGGLPQVHQTAGTTHDLAQPAHSWSVEAVATYFEKNHASGTLPNAPSQCRLHRISGHVLLSMTGEDAATQLQLSGIPEARAFEAAVASLRAREAKLPPAQEIAAEAGRLSVLVMQALVDSDGSGGASRHEPAQFPLAYVRRCTHGFASEHLIGTGAFGRVYRAVDPVGGVRFAVKRLVGPEEAASPGTDGNVDGAAQMASPQRRLAAERGMRREIEVLRSVRHPNIIRLIGFCLPSADRSVCAEPCLIYELGTHGSVADNLKDDTKAAAFTWKHRVRVLAGLASALNYLHRSHSPPVFHRDVKSANIVLTHGMVPKLIDCGLAHLLSEEQAAQHLDQEGGKSLFTLGSEGLLGTPGYMCPRYVASGKFGEKSEIFSMGVTMLEVLLGRLNKDVANGLYTHYIEDEAEGGLSPAVAGTTAAASAATPTVRLDARAGHWPTLEVSTPLLQLAASCLASYKNRPRTMQSVLRVLKRLERDLCAPTVAEVEQRVAAVEAQNQALVEARQSELRKRYHEEQEAAAAAAAAEEASRRTCCICYDDFPNSAGVTCGAQEDEEAETPHFLCDDCFGGHVMAESEKDLHDLQRRKGQVFCVCRSLNAGGEDEGNDTGADGCPWAEAFSEQVVAGHTTQAVFGAYLQAQRKLAEQTLVQEMEQVYEARLAAERHRIASMTADQIQIASMRKHIVDRLLTLKCPRCEAAFLDFKNCFALTCHRCDCRFCGYCLTDCGVGHAGYTASHHHVARCAHNPKRADGTRRVFAEPGKEVSTFEQTQRARRQRMVHGYLATIESKALRAKVMDACARDFADLNLEISLANVDVAVAQAAGASNGGGGAR